MSKWQITSTDEELISTGRTPEKNGLYEIVFNKAFMIKSKSSESIAFAFAGSIDGATTTQTRFLTITDKNGAIIKGTKAKFDQILKILNIPSPREVVEDIQLFNDQVVRVEVLPELAGKRIYGDLEFEWSIYDGKAKGSYRVLGFFRAEDRASVEEIIYQKAPYGSKFKWRQQTIETEALSGLTCSYVGCSPKLIKELRAASANGDTGLTASQSAALSSSASAYGGFGTPASEDEIPF